MCYHEWNSGTHILAITKCSLIGHKTLRCKSKNGPHGLISLNAWSTEGETIWERLGVMALLEELWLCWRRCVSQGDL